jgi:hypothetical protein
MLTTLLFHPQLWQTLTFAPDGLQIRTLLSWIHMIHMFPTMYVLCPSHIYWLHYDCFRSTSTNSSMVVTSPLRQHITFAPNGLQLRTLLSCIRLAFKFPTMYVLCPSHIYWLHYDCFRSTSTNSSMIHRYYRLVVVFPTKVFPTSNSISIQSSTQRLIVIHNNPHYFESSYLHN